MNDKKRVLILCTGNSCRSQMAEGVLKSFGDDVEVFSAGTNPAEAVHPLAVKVMSEINIDISKNHPKSVDPFLDQEWEYVITVCDNANTNCPVFPGKVKRRIHIGFDDPAAFTGAPEEVANEFRLVRDEIEEAFTSFYLAFINPSVKSGGCGCGCGCSS
jgi:arsenate reductase (thioredoxin)